VKILVVDDDEMARQLLTIYLSRAGHTIVEAAEGRSAWEVFQRENTRLIITDLMMLEVSGIELIRRIRADSRTGYTYLMILTALGDKAQVVTGLESGADDYLTKPFNPEELLARVSIGERILKLEDSLNESRRQMEYLAMHDTLTGMLNRRALQDHAEAELSRARRSSTPVSLAVLDLDHFKSINDRYGHLVGDQALQHVATILIRQIRTYDWAGRWGGEEFLLVLPDTALPEARMVAERIREDIAATVLALPNGSELRLTASLGVASAAAASGEIASLDELVRQADHALYHAKSEGRNRVCLAGEAAGD
jgi:diguanylate cyclase (GGDEF)-like protein